MTNKKLHIKKYGSGNPLILLHGWGWHSGIWNTLIPQLIHSFEVYCIDLPGFGKSPLSSQSYEIQEVAEQIFSIVPETATWLGWSLGGMIAWWIALRYPAKVERLITIGSSPRFVAAPDWPGVDLQVLDNFKKLLLQDTHKTLVDFLELQLRGSVHYQELFSSLKNQLFTEHTLPSHETLLASLSLLSTLDLRHELHKMQCPSVHIFGSNDTLVPASVVPLIQSLLSYGQCEVIKRSGHMPFLTHGEVVRDCVLGNV